MDVIHSDRVRQRMEALGLTQPKLAARVGMTQGAIAKIAKNNPNGSSKLHLIARALLTTPAYLTGETDDPDEGAPSPAPAPTVQFVTMQVALPPEPALARMFEGLLRMMPADASLDERAQLLARRLPIGLSQLRDLLPSGPAIAMPAATPAEAPPTPVPAPHS